MSRRTEAVALNAVDLDLECTHCHARMTSHVGSGGQVRYYRCPSCQRWLSSTYAEAMRADTKIRTRKASTEAPAVAAGSVKERLERWLRAIDDRNPYTLLDVSPLDNDDMVKERYRQLALRHHPDRGGNPDTMRRLNDAYARIVAHRNGSGPISSLPGGA